MFYILVLLGVFMANFFLFSFSIFSLIRGAFADVPNSKSLANLAHKFLDSYTQYIDMPLGSLERLSKDKLKEAYLSCKAPDFEITYKVGSHTEVIKKLENWKRKCSKGILRKKNQNTDIEEFIKVAQSYSSLYKQVSQSPEYIAYYEAKKAYKEAVLNLLKQGYSIKEINLTLKAYGINNENLFDQTSYWQTIEL